MMLVRLAGVEDHSQVGVTVPCDLCRNSGHGASCPFALLAESRAPLRPSSLSKILSYGDELKSECTEETAPGFVGTPPPQGPSEQVEGKVGKIK